MDKRSFRIRRESTGTTISLPLYLRQATASCGLYDVAATGTTSIVKHSAYTISGRSQSDLFERFDYDGKLKIGVNGVTAITSTYTAYTVSGVVYYHSADGPDYSVFEHPFYSYRQIDTLIATDSLFGFVDAQEVNNVRIERGGWSVTENVMRLKDIARVTDFDDYNNKFFTVNK